MIGIECNADEVLLKTLGIPGKNLKHAQGRGQVCHYVERGIVSTGLVDEDPESLYTLPKLLRNRQPEELPWGLKVYRGTQRGKRWRVVVFCPRLEEWILQAAKEAGANPSQFALSDSGEGLHRDLSTGDPEPMERFSVLVKELRSRRSPRLRELKRLLRI